MILALVLLISGYLWILAKLAWLLVRLTLYLAVLMVGAMLVMIVVPVWALVGALTENRADPA